MLKTETCTETREVYFLDDQTGKIWSQKTQLTFPHTYSDTPHLDRLLIVLFISFAVLLIAGAGFGSAWDSTSNPLFLGGLIACLATFFADAIIISLIDDKKNDEDYSANAATQTERAQAIKAIGGYAKRSEAEKVRAEKISEELYKSHLDKLNQMWDELVYIRLKGVDKNEKK